MLFVFIEIIGWLGMLCILLAYGLVSNQKINPDSKAAQLLNLFGAGFVIVNVAYHMAIPSVVLNSIWFLIALLGLLKNKPKNDLKKSEETRTAKIIVTVTDGGDFGFDSCGHCGKIVKDHPKKCPHCGVNLVGSELGSPTGGSDF